MIYSPQIGRAKNGSPTPLFSDGTSMHSSYNPEREASSFGAELSSDSGFIVVGGIGGGFHIASLREKFPNALIVCFEADNESLSFCKQIPFVSNLENNKTFFCTVTELKNNIITKYLPVLHNAFAFTVQRSWADKNKDIAEYAKAISDEALKSISADYSVQSHFGRIWQRNILLNLEFFSHLSNFQNDISFDTKKTAAVIAAGPSLDETISLLHNNRSDYAIFSTDTAYGSLLSHNIIPDAVVSIDGQLVSETHFYGCSRGYNPLQETSFFFDLSASPTAARFVSDKGYSVHFLQSGHPLSSLACSPKDVPFVNTGSGTVTIAAADLARNVGFTKIAIFGADFCYSSGKPYTKGTYLDTNFSIASSRLSPLELSFSALQFRTPLVKQTEPALFSGKLKNAFTTEILQSYGKTLLSWVQSVGGIHTGNTVTLPAHAITAQWKFAPYSFASFITSWLTNLESVCTDQTADQTDNRYVISLYPYLSFLKSHIESSNKQSIFDLLKLAYSDAVRYNNYL